MMNATPPTNYVLIDMENVKPDNLAKLLGLPFKVYVFLGESQVKVPFEFAESMQRLGENARYIKMTGNGPNALDFHIAYYLGELAVSDPDAYFHIISKDTGFDPLVAHLRGARKLRVSRCGSIEEISLLRKAEAGTPAKRLEIVLENFQRRGESVPRKLQTLEATIHAIFGKKLLDGEVKQLIDALQKRKFVIQVGTKLHYQLPAPQGNGHAVGLAGQVSPE
jgi:hypothetical protein